MLTADILPLQKSSDNEDVPPSESASDVPAKGSDLICHLIGRLSNQLKPESGIRKGVTFPRYVKTSNLSSPV